MRSARARACLWPAVLVTGPPCICISRFPVLLLSVQHLNPSCQALTIPRGPESNRIHNKKGNSRDHGPEAVIAANSATKNSATTNSATKASPSSACSRVIVCPASLCAQSHHKSAAAHHDPLSSRPACTMARLATRYTWGVSSRQEPPRAAQEPTRPATFGPPDEHPTECVLFIGTQFSILYTFMYSPA